MEKYLIPAALLLGAALLIVLIILAARALASGRKTDERLRELSGRIDSEFERARRENYSAQKDMREETARALGEMNGRIEQLRLENKDNSRRTEQEIARSLGEIRDKNEEQSEKQTRRLNEAVDKMRESNEKKLEEMRNTVDEKLTSTLSTRLDSSFKTVSERLESVYKSLGEMKELSSGVTDNVTALNRVLTNVKARGTWAEVQLGALLDQTLPGMYETNFACVPGSKDRVEFAVKIPTENGDPSYLPIDSKFPLEDYVRLCDAADAGNPEALEAARKALEARVLNEAKMITKYINVPVTTPFAIMYLATEGLYAEITSSKTGVAEKVQSEMNIMIAGPSTITALLNSLSLGFRAVAVNKKANEVRLLLGAAKQQYEKFGLLIEKARKKVEEAGSALDEADKRNNLIRKKLGGVETGDENPDELLGITDNTYTQLKEDEK
ncbi:MAG: DNA recombination protein RmuC [Clostridia bacterium]|nr:DNA recombination protein RmuC [Clostridia bacterium]